MQATYTTTPMGPDKDDGLVATVLLAVFWGTIDAGFGYIDSDVVVVAIGACFVAISASMFFIAD